MHDSTFTYAILKNIVPILMDEFCLKVDCSGYNFFDCLLVSA